jgi:hypothetical protein
VALCAFHRKGPGGPLLRPTASRIPKDPWGGKGPQRPKTNARRHLHPPERMHCGVAGCLSGTTGVSQQSASGLARANRSGSEDPVRPFPGGGSRASTGLVPLRPKAPGFQLSPVDPKIGGPPALLLSQERRGVSPGHSTREPPRAGARRLRPDHTTAPEGTSLAAAE